MERVITLILCLGLIGCASTPPPSNGPKDIATIITKATPHPVEPEWKTFTRKPVIKSYTVDGKENYEVSDEFVEKSLQLQDYADRIKKWKLKNLIP